MKFAKQRVMLCDQGLGTHLARRNVSAERLPSRAQVLYFAAVVGRAVERCFGQLLVADRNTESRAELAQFVFVELLLLVGDVAPLAAFTEAVALDGARENDGRRALVFKRSSIRGVDLPWIVPALAHGSQRLIRQVFDHLQQPWVAAENMLANVGAGLHADLLRFAVHHFAQALG